MGNNLYWNVYKSLERELLSLAEIIHIDDSQLDVLFNEDCGFINSYNC